MSTLKEFLMFLSVNTSGKYCAFKLNPLTLKFQSCSHFLIASFWFALCLPLPSTLPETICSKPTLCQRDLLSHSSRWQIREGGTNHSEQTEFDCLICWTEKHSQNCNRSATFTNGLCHNNAKNNDGQAHNEMQVVSGLPLFSAWGITGACWYMQTISLVLTSPLALVFPQHYQLFLFMLHFFPLDHVTKHYQVHDIHIV